MDIKSVSFKIYCELDFGFWNLFPSINISLHSHELEFEWLCIGVYISKIKDDEKDFFTPFVEI